MSTLFDPVFSLNSPENIKNLWFSDVLQGIKREDWEGKD